MAGTKANTRVIKAVDRSSPLFSVVLEMYQNRSSVIAMGLRIITFLSLHSVSLVYYLYCYDYIKTPKMNGTFPFTLLLLCVWLMEKAAAHWQWTRHDFVVVSSTLSNRSFIHLCLCTCAVQVEFLATVIVSLTDHASTTCRSMGIFFLSLPILRHLPKNKLATWIERERWKKNE